MGMSRVTFGGKYGNGKIVSMYNLCLNQNHGAEIQGKENGMFELFLASV